MKAEYKIKQAILDLAIKNGDFEWNNLLKTEEEIEKAYSAFEEEDVHWEYKNAFRCGGEETNIPSDWSRHYYYETKSVAQKLDDGSWVGWTYYYGGGKHAEPEAIEWMEDAYDLECKEEERLVIIREFKKI